MSYITLKLLGRLRAFERGHCRRLGFAERFAKSITRSKAQLVFHPTSWPGHLMCGFNARLKVDVIVMAENAALAAKQAITPIAVSEHGLRRGGKLRLSGFGLP